MNDLFGYAEQRIRELGGEGILNETDVPKLNASCQRVYELMKDGGWYRADQIRLAAGRDGREASEGLRRMRELRKHGFDIEMRRLSDDSANFEYRIKYA